MTSIRSSLSYIRSPYYCLNDTGCTVIKWLVTLEVWSTKNEKQPAFGHWHGSVHILATSVKSFISSVSQHITRCSRNVCQWTHCVLTFTQDDKQVFGRRTISRQSWCLPMQELRCKWTRREGVQDSGGLCRICTTRRQRNDGGHLLLQQVRH